MKKDKTKEVSKSNQKFKEESSIINNEDYIPKVNIYFYDPDALAGLLKTDDLICTIQVCDFLRGYIIKNPDYGSVLVDNGIVEDVINKSEDSYPDYNSSRYLFLGKLHEMYPKSRPMMEARPNFTRMAAYDAAHATDIRLLGCSLLYYHLLTQNKPPILNELLDKYGLTNIFTKYLPNSDVDVKYNTLGLMKNLLQFKKWYMALVELPEFSFNDLMDQCKCPFPAIQSRALEVVGYLLERKEKEEYVYGLFTKAGGFDYIFKLLNVYEWRDIHPKIMNVIRIMFRDGNNLHQLQELSGIVRLCNYINFIFDEDLIAEDLRTLLEICSTYEGKMIMLKEDVLIKFIFVLKSGSQECKILVCECIRVMVTETEGIMNLGDNDPSKILIKLMLDECNIMELRCSCACALSALARTTPISRLIMYNDETFKSMVKVLEEPLQLTPECTCTVMETVSTLLSIPAQLNKLISFNLTKNLLSLMEKEEPEEVMLCQYAAEVLSWTLARESGREWFVGLSGVSRVMKVLYDTTDPVLLNNIGLMIRMIAERDYDLTECFIRAGVIKWLIENKPIWNFSPRLETATEAIFHFNLALKFDYWGRLDITDITKDGFYCSRYTKAGNLPLASEVADIYLCPVKPIYIVNMGLTDPKELRKEDSRSWLLMNKNEKEKRKENEDDESTSSTSIKHAGLSNFSKTLILDSLKNNHTDEFDYKLLSLYNALDREMSKCPYFTKPGRNKFEYRWIQEWAFLVGKLVDQALTGKSTEDECDYHNLEMHITEIKVKLKSSLIPLGELDIGLKLERAVLFKVLADRFELPCALVRGRHAIAWVEVYVSPMNHNYPDLPLKNIRTNYLIDLVDDPGKLIRLNTLEATIYCGRPMPGVLENMPRHLSDEKPAWMSYKMDKKAEPETHVEIY